MGKWAIYEKKFKPSWLQDPAFKKWLVAVEIDNTKASCKYCGNLIRAHKADLTKHAGTSKHLANTSNLVGTTSIAQSFKSMTSESLKKIRHEIKLAVYIACHSSIRAVDFLNVFQF